MQIIRFEFSFLSSTPFKIATCLLLFFQKRYIPLRKSSVRIKQAVVIKERENKNGNEVACVVCAHLVYLHWAGESPFALCNLLVFIPLNVYLIDHLGMLWTELAHR